VYEALLDFYFEAMNRLASSNFIFKNSTLPEIITRFNDNTKTLQDLIAVETLKLLETVKEVSEENFIRTLLDGNTETNEAELYNSLRSRANEACSWVADNGPFNQWLRRAGFCVLSGGLGSGKSVTSSFVVDFLNGLVTCSGGKWTRPRPAPVNPLVCAYYCKDDTETNKARNIYRSILCQTLNRTEALKAKFLEWYRKKKGEISLANPMFDDNAMRDFLVELLSIIPGRRVYLIIDGIGQCDQSSRTHLSEFFASCARTPSLVNILVSMRPTNKKTDGLPAERIVLEMMTDEQRDRLIAVWLFEQIIREESSECSRELIIDYVSKNASGSSLWQRLVLEYIARIDLALDNEEQVKKQLRHLPPPERLSQLYGQIYEKHGQGVQQNYSTIACALEILAAAQRPLTLDELVYAVALHTQPDMKSLATLEEGLRPTKVLLKLMRPFVAVDPTKTSTSAPVHLVHHSLNELILRLHPSKWASSQNIPSENDQHRADELNKLLLKCCLTYLTFEEFNENDMFPGDKLGDMEADDFMRTVRNYEVPLGSIAQSSSKRLD
jgi:hypothetical protein